MPNMFVVGVEDMRTIDVFHYAGFRIPRGVTVPAEVIPLVNHKAAAAGLRQFTGNNSTGKTSSYNKYFMTT
jgi:hypothetical protein